MGVDWRWTNRKVGRSRRSGQVNKSVVINGNRRVSLIPGPAEVRRVSDGRIDHQFPAAIIGSNLEAHAIGRPEHEPAFNRLLMAGSALINAGSLQSDVSPSSLKNQISVAQFQLSPTIKLQLGLGWIGARRNLEVVLQMTLAAVKNHVDARINALITDSGKLRNPGAATFSGRCQ